MWMETVTWAGRDGTFGQALRWCMLRWPLPVDPRTPGLFACFPVDGFAHCLANGSCR